MLDWKVEPLTWSLIGEMIPIQDGYWKEVAGPFHDYPPDVDWKMYLTAQERGMLRVITGRDAGVLKGGSVIVIGPHPHYACVSASLPLLFIDPEYRRGREGLKLVRMSEQVASEAGAQLMMTHGGVHNGVFRLFEFMEYQDFGRYFVKRIADTPPVFKAVK